MSLKNLGPILLILGPIAVVGILAMRSFRSESQRPNPEEQAPANVEQKNWEALRPMLQQTSLLQDGDRYRVRGGKVVTLNLVSQDLTNQNLSGVADMPELANVRIIGADLTDEYLVSFKDLQKIESLILRFERRGDGVKHLGGLQSLRVLELSECAGLNDSDLEHIARLTGLRELKLVNCPGVTDAGLKHLASLSGLEKLELSGCKGVTDAGLEALGGKEALVELNLESASIVGPGLAHLASSTALENLVLSKTQVTDEGLASLAECKSLKALHLSGTPVTGSGFKALAGLPSLSMVFLVGAGVDDDGADGIAAIIPLQSLYLDETGISGAALIPLTKLPNLTELRIPGCKGVTDADLAHIRDMPALTHLTLEDGKFTTAAFEHLRPVKTLKLIGLHGNSMLESDVAALREDMPGTMILF